MEPFAPLFAKLKHRLIVSCQAPEGDTFHRPTAMAEFALAATRGGAAGIRANGAADIEAIRSAVNVPIIGISKRIQDDGKILITGSFNEARELNQAGADIIALDCTARGQRYGALERIRKIKAELGVPVFADIATIEESVAAAQAGADVVLSTMRGYTPETSHVHVFEPSFIADLSRISTVPVIAEGRVLTPGLAVEALLAGAFAVVVGSSITRPQEISARFAMALDPFRATPGCGGGYVLGIDLGGTNTKFGIVGREGELISATTVPTPALEGRQTLLDHLKRVTADCLILAQKEGLALAALGVSTAGWVDPFSGTVVYATENLPGWTGTRIADELRPVAGIPVAVENDGNAAAIAERYFGCGKDTRNFVCITLGTGVGGGSYVNGQLMRGGNFFANALGHIIIEEEGIPCTCGRRGCLEAYTNAHALMKYAAGNFATSEDVIREANLGNRIARDAVRILAHHLARGCRSIVSLIDPEKIILSGGLAQGNRYLATDLEQKLSESVSAWNQRRLKISISTLGYYAGVLGAAAAGLELLASSYSGRAADKSR